MKYGIRLSIDVSKIDKARLYKGRKGVYLDATCFMDPDNPGDYGDHGMITQDVPKEEREKGVKGAILGNVKVFWTDDSAPATAPAKQEQESDFDDDIPFN